MKKYCVKDSDLTGFVSKLFQGYGILKEDADEFAMALVDADKCNVSSHGTVRIQTYLQQIKDGKMNIKTTPETICETPCTALMDGGNGLGMITSARATAKAVELAEKSGIGFVTVRGCNHFGRAGYWSAKLAGENRIGFTVSNTTPILSAPASNTRIIGSNPFSVAIPAGKYGHMCLDISNGIMAMGKIYDYARQNKPLPEGAWLDAKGNPTTDPRANAVPDFTMRPVGVHKGFGLAVVMEALTAILSAGTFCPRSAIIPASEERKPSLSQSYFAMKIDSFRPLDEFVAEMEEFIEYLHNAPVREGMGNILYPGELEEMSMAQKEKDGIVLPGDIVEFLISATEERGLTADRQIFRAVED